MILVVGALGSGKRSYVQALGYTDADFSSRFEGKSARKPVLDQAHELVRPPESDPVALAHEITSTIDVVICDEVGSGIVPIDAGERAWRERAGVLSRELARHAESVVRMACGIPTALKGPLPQARGAFKLVIMRHGTTSANEQRVYAGSTDVPLTPAGEKQALQAGQVANVGKVYVSSLSRAQRTASLCFPNAFQRIVEGLEEMDFGAFEGRSADDMADDEAYRAWVESNCTLPCPQGESRAVLVERTARALTDIARETVEGGARCAIVVAHGGTIMAAMEAFAAHAGRDYFEWQVGNCEGYEIDAVLDGDSLRFDAWRRFRDLSFLGPEPDGGEPRFAAHSFFQNTACKYFPCHEGVDPSEFNCLFCYCPLYALGPDCGGSFTYTESGRKNCTGCALPHIRDNGTALVSRHYDQLADLARNRDESLCP